MTTTLIATRSPSMLGRGPRTPHIAAPTRGKPGEIQQNREDINYLALMLEGKVAAPSIFSTTKAEFDHAGATTDFAVKGRGFIPPGWEQARKTVVGVVNSNLEWIAIEPGKDGNDIQVEYVDGGPAAPTAVDWSAVTKKITVTFDLAAGTVDAVAVLVALAASATGANYIVMARHVFGSTGAGLIAAYTAANLVGGRGSALRRASLLRGVVANSGLVWTARKPGPEGNLISVTYRTGLGAGLLPVITASGYAIDVYLRAAATTAADILRALETADVVRDLVDVEPVFGSNNTGLPGAIVVASLANGADGAAVRVLVGGELCDIQSITDTDIVFDAPTMSPLAADQAVLVRIDVCGYVTELQGIVV